MVDISDTIRKHYAEDNPRLLLTPNVLIQHGAAPNIVFVATLSGCSQPAIVAEAAVLPMSIILPSTAVTGQSGATAAPPTTAPPRRTRQCRFQPHHTIPEVKAFLPRRSRSQPRRVKYDIGAQLPYCSDYDRVGIQGFQ
uniref:Uncharacterized protein n=1 Tax=Daphnia galeata TaxID=27404 RepID=A0A8J2RMF5_9CRUS|nr:unnamed protein product [Daphnia galeata]